MKQLHTKVRQYSMKSSKSGIATPLSPLTPIQNHGIVLLPVRGVEAAGIKKQTSCSLSNQKSTGPSVFPHFYFEAEKSGCKIFAGIERFIEKAAVNWKLFEENHVNLSPVIPRIIGGNEATPHQYPFQVGLLLNNNAFCGGSLISKNFVLTAAHCATVLLKRIFDILIPHYFFSLKNDNCFSL
ncbi:hypothetical protein NQ315_003780 [Exocentrus adspersus]|uniref:Peptidase S1 domain-containing protein n=1 Tax=Exocentrus adspersus TaxID=1586481 RepID=A0AAV8V894_9CUCU|nr:hypothetical protein NQ315_003780 [Exocentrus adspersus]